MFFRRSVSTSLLLVMFGLSAGACDMLHGDKNVDTVPPNARSDGPGLFTGKKGGIVIESGVWSGASPYGDTAE